MRLFKLSCWFSSRRHFFSAFPSLISRTKNRNQLKSHWVYDDDFVIKMRHAKLVLFACPINGNDQMNWNKVYILYGISLARGAPMQMMMQVFLCLCINLLPLCCTHLSFFCFLLHPQLFNSTERVGRMLFNPINHFSYWSSSSWNISGGIYRVMSAEWCMLLVFFFPYFTVKFS